MGGVLSNKIRRDELKPGDHIYSWRSGYIYSHHGVYVGDEKVIHFTQGADGSNFSSSPHYSETPCPRCGYQSKAKGVISSCLDCFLSGGELYLFHYGVSPAFFLAQVRGGTCTLARSDPTEHVLYRAEFLLQNGFGVYDIFKNNCEDFAIYCKTGLLILTAGSLGLRGQAASVAAAATALASFPLSAAVGCSIYCLGRFISDIGVRPDATKIPVERLISSGTR